MCKIDAWAIALDETDRYGIAADAPLIKQIRAVYLFDRNQRTHVCELTPSYWLIHLYDQVILVDDDIDESRREELYETYECHPGEDIYVHCSAIDRILDQGDRSVVDHYGDIEVSLDDYNDQMESIREYLCGNRSL